MLTEPTEEQRPKPITQSRSDASPRRARLSAEARAVARAEERTPEQAFAQPIPPPLSETNSARVQPDGPRPVEQDILPDPDDPNFPHSRKNAHYNPYSPSVLRAEKTRRAIEEDKKKYLSALEEGSPEWVKLSLVIEAKHCGKALYRIRALEILGRINKQYTDVIELRGGLTHAEQELAVANAVKNLLGKMPSHLLEASAEIRIPEK